MSAISDILLAAGAIAAGFYCMVLARRLRRFTDLEKGMGGAVAVLSAQVDDLTRTLVAAQKSASSSVATLTTVTGRAEDSARRIELLLASMHDLPEAPVEVPTLAQAQAQARPSRSPYFMRQAERPGSLT